MTRFGTVERSVSDVHHSLEKPEFAKVKGVKDSAKILADEFEYVKDTLNLYENWMKTEINPMVDMGGSC